LVLDLDGDGIEAVGIDPARPILLDHDGDGDGTRSATGWIKGEDSIVVLDRNDDSGRELFGDQTLLPTPPTAVVASHQWHHWGERHGRSHRQPAGFQQLLPRILG